MSDDPIYSLIVKAETDRQALEALDANAHIAVSRFVVEPVPGGRHRLLTVEFAFGDGSEFGHDLDAFRRPIEHRLNKWLLRDRREPDAIGSLLWWERE